MTISKRDLIILAVITLLGSFVVIRATMYKREVSPKEVLGRFKKVDVMITEYNDSIIIKETFYKDSKTGEKISSIELININEQL